MSNIVVCTFPASSYPIKECEGGVLLPQNVQDVLVVDEPCESIVDPVEILVDPHCDETVGIRGGITDGILFPPPIEDRDV